MCTNRSHLIRSTVSIVAPWPRKYDVERIEERFVSLLGQDRVEVLRFHDFPAVTGIGPSDTWTPYRPPAPFVPIVVVTAFSTPNVRTWDALVERWVRQLHAVTFLVPHEAERVPRGLVSKARVVTWDRATTVRSARRTPKPGRVAMQPAASRSTDPLDRLQQMNPDAAQLASYASLAAYVEPALLRELRFHLMPNATSSAELDLWTSDVATTSTRDGFVLAPRVIQGLRTKVSANDRLSVAIEIVRRLHGHAPPLLRLEERLVELSLGEANERTEEKVRRELEPVLTAMEQSPTRRKNLAHWFARTVARLPPAIVNSDVGRLLGFVTSSHVPGAAGVTALPSPAALGRAAKLLREEREAQIAVRRRAIDGRLVLEVSRVVDGSRPDESWHLLRVTWCDPLVVWVNDEPVTVGAALARLELSSPLQVPRRSASAIRDISGKQWELAP